MSETMHAPVVFAYALSGAARGAPLDSDAEIAAALRDDAPAWLHLQADHPGAEAWIDRHLDYLDPSVRDALTEVETRPRALRLGQGLLVNLRGINLNPGADPEDMVSLRLYIDPARIVTLSRRPLRSVEALAKEVRDGAGPERAGAHLAALVERITERIETHVADLETRADDLEAQTIAAPRTPALRAGIADQRLELTDLRRFLVPQRDAMRDIARCGLSWIEEPDARKLAEQLDQVIRVTETLEATREQLQTIRDEIEGARADRLNRNLYVLSVISAVFLPLGFLTGLMGINLAGMPGADWAPAFWTFTLGLAAAAAGVLGLLRIFDIL